MKDQYHVNLWQYVMLPVLVLLFPCSCSPEKSEPDEKPPNILFIMSDDHAFQAVSAYGHGLNNTPNIDRIAKEGAIFHKGFVSNSICAPSRAAMLTGKHSFVNGKVDNMQPFDWEQPNFCQNASKSRVFNRLGRENPFEWATAGLRLFVRPSWSGTLL